MDIKARSWLSFDKNHKLKARSWLSFERIKVIIARSWLSYNQKTDGVPSFGNNDKYGVPNQEV